MHEPETFYPPNQASWRAWLEEHHLSKQSVWVVFYVRSSPKPSISWSDAVDEALCFGWIDSKRIKIDEETSHQFFSRRKPKSTWSKINKVKVQSLIKRGLMKKAGLDCIKVAMENGSWTLLDEVEELIIPKDLEKALKKHRGAKTHFLSLSKSVQKMMLTSLVLARRPETRQKRIDEIAELAGQKKRPSQF
jgi:uncharacterized protein YdeI (YjbR/CyaY-like superfamily)